MVFAILNFPKLARLGYGVSCLTIWVHAGSRLVWGGGFYFISLPFFLSLAGLGFYPSRRGKTLVPFVVRKLVVVFYFLFWTSELVVRPSWLF